MHRGNFALNAQKEFKMNLRCLPAVAAFFFCVVPLFAQQPAVEAARPDQLLFASNRTGSWNVCVVNADGTGLKALASGDSDTGQPAWSPDGKSIAFVSERDGDVEIYIMNADGTGQKRLTEAEGEDIQPTWTPSGKRIVFSSDRGGHPAIFIMDPAGGNLLQLTEDGAEATLPVVAPDGKTIAFESGKDGTSSVRVVRPDRSLGDPIAAGKNGARRPAWSPDSKLIAFQSCGSPEQIFTANADGSGVRQLTQLAGSCTGPAWSPEGKCVLFASFVDEVHKVFTVDIGGKPRCLTKGKSDDSQPCWSPDGSRIAFISSANDKSDICVMNADGSGLKKIVTLDGEVQSLQWRPGRKSGPAIVRGIPATVTFDAIEIFTYGEQEKDKTAISVKEAKDAPAAPHGLKPLGKCYDVTWTAPKEEQRFPVAVKLDLPDKAMASDATKAFFIGSHDGAKWTMLPADLQDGKAVAFVEHFSVIGLFSGDRATKPSQEEVNAARIGKPKFHGFMIHGEYAWAQLDISDCRTAYEPGSWFGGVAVEKLRVYVKRPAPEARNISPMNDRFVPYVCDGEEVFLKANFGGPQKVPLEFDAGHMMEISANDTAASAYAWDLTLAPVYSDGSEGPQCEPARIFAGAAQAMLGLRRGLLARLGDAGAHFAEMTDRNPYYVFVDSWIPETYAHSTGNWRRSLNSAIWSGTPYSYMGIAGDSDYGRVICHEWGHYAANMIYGDDAFAKMPSGAHSGWKEANSRSEGLASFLGQCATGSGVPDAAGSMDGNWSDYSRKPAGEGAADILWPQKSMDTTRVESVVATVLSKMMTQFDTPRLYAFLRDARPANLVDLFKFANATTTPSADTAELQRIYQGESLLWRARGRVLIEPEKPGPDAKPEPVEDAKILLRPLAKEKAGAAVFDMVMTDSNGEFQTWLPPGDVLFEVRHPDLKRPQWFQFAADTSNPSYVNDPPEKMRDFILKRERENRGLLFLKNGRIHVANGDGSEGLQLTRDNISGKGLEMDPAWSPDGSKIVFTYLGNDADGAFELIVSDADGRNIRGLVLHDAKAKIRRNPAWSPDGTQIAYQWATAGGYEDTGCLCVMAADGSGQKFFAQTKQGEVRYPQWSPDGKRIFFYRQWHYEPEGEDGYYSVNADGSDLKRICGTYLAMNTDCMNYRVTPDGARLVFMQYEKKSDSWQLYSVDAGGGTPKKLTDFERKDRIIWAGLGFSPDMTRFAASTSRPDEKDEAKQLLIANIDGGERKILTEFSYDEHIHVEADDGFSWSPDGKCVAFVTIHYMGAWQKDIHDLWVVSPDGAGLKKIAEDVNGWPSWQPAGK
jgi:TolB protein